MLFYLDTVCTIPSDGTDIMANFNHTMERLKQIKEIRKNQPVKLISGEDVMEIFNITPGEAVGKVLHHIAELKDAGKLNTKKEALEYLRRVEIDQITK